MSRTCKPRLSIALVVLLLAGVPASRASDGVTSPVPLRAPDGGRLPVGVPTLELDGRAAKSTPMSTPAHP
jgi:hypothetical protein